MRNLYLLLVVSFGSGFYALLPLVDERLPGGLRVGDVGLGLILPGVLLVLYRARDRTILLNQFTVLIIILMFMVAVQIAMASMNYGQPLLAGFVPTRLYFYYFSFVLFVFLLDDVNRLSKFMDLLSWVSCVVIILSLVNYSVTVIFYHPWAEGHNVRSGIVRAYIPAMDMLTLAGIWRFAKWIELPGAQTSSGLIAAFIYAAHVWRQSRGRLISLTLILLGLMVYKKKWKALAAASVAILIGYLTLQQTMEENILENAFESSAENLMDSTGTWAYRKQAMQSDLNIFLDNIWLGSGTIALSLPEGGKYSEEELEELKEIANAADLGYSRVIKAFGAPGVFWLLAFFYFFISNSLKASKLATGQESKTLAMMAASYTVYMLISSITLNHFMLPDRVMFMCLCATILIRIQWDARNRTHLEQV
jgi:hypothetical protein